MVRPVTQSVGAPARPPGKQHAVLARRAAVCAWDDGPRSWAEAKGLSGAVRRSLLPLSTIVCADTSDPVLGLTYDDGPDPESTPAVLDVLASVGSHATFFVLLEAARRHPAVVRACIEAGHEVGLHGVDHRDLTLEPMVSSVAALMSARRELADLTGCPVRLFRPAYGAIRLDQVALLRALGMRVVLWSAWARDWDGAPAKDVALRAARAYHPGAVLLLHDAQGAPAMPEGGSLRRRTSDSPDPGPADPAGASAILLRFMTESGIRSLTVTELLEERREVRTLWGEWPRLPGAPARPVATARAERGAQSRGGPHRG